MSEKIAKKIGFIGCGNMGSAILKGLKRLFTLAYNDAKTL